MHKLMCIVLSVVVIALCRAIRVVCLHDVSMIAIGVEGADQGCKGIVGRGELHCLSGDESRRAYEASHLR
jgi:hypothetical protein